MRARDFLRKAVYRPAVFLCILSFGSASASPGYQTASPVYKEYMEINRPETTEISRNSIFGLAVARPETVKCITTANLPRSALSNVIGKVTASWYGPRHHNKLTASGQRFNMNKNTLAHRTLPMGTKLLLVNPDNGKSVEGVVNDRGPYVRGRDVDLSYEMAKQLGFLKKGVTKLDIEMISVAGETYQ